MDPTEQARLAQQHQYISTGLGFVVHPTIARDLSKRKEDVSIANVSKEFQLPGVGDEDSSAELKYNQPVNFTFQDITSQEGTLRKHEGQFDIVAVRVLHTALPHDTWDVAIRNLISLLRPGGWLQWTDWDPPTPRIAAINPAASDFALRNLLARYVDCLKANKVGTTYRIPTSMRNYGLEDDDSDMYPLAPEVELTRNVTTGTIKYLQRSGNLNDAEAGEVQEKVDQEIEIGKPLLWVDLWSHIAKKPS